MTVTLTQRLLGIIPQIPLSPDACYSTEYHPHRAFAQRFGVSLRIYGSHVCFCPAGLGFRRHIP